MAEYTFTSLSDDKAAGGTEWLLDICKAQDELDAARIQSKLLALYGRPTLTSENFENAVEYVFKVTNADRNQIVMTVYNSAGRIAVGTHPSTRAEAKKAVKDLIAALDKAERIDFEQTCFFLPEYLSIRFGVKEGRPFFEREPITVQQAEKIEKRWYGDN